MWNWLFPPTCPCDPLAKEWVEDRLLWLAEEFPDSAFSGRPVILPTPRYFPDRYDGTYKTVRTMLDRICYYMDVEPASVELVFFKNTDTYLVNDQGHAVGQAAGTFEMDDDGFRIRVETSQLLDPMTLVGTLAHELAHVRLLGEDRIWGEVYDHELVTDLTVVHFGLGIFLANVPRGGWRSGYTQWPDSQLLKPEYMNDPMYGWALAHLALFREEPDPAWAAHLKTGPRTNLRQGLRYLRATGDTTYRPR
ncbi:MAG: hypothetical protein SFX18_13035 [Pirellulales bacterium]|nr:hypothetical protein [Pirellulales bacterium]